VIRAEGNTLPLRLDAIDQRLLDDFQRALPMEPRPFARLGERLGIDESEVIERLQRLERCGAVSRVGAVLPPNRVGASTLAALAVPPADLAAVAELVSAYTEVNHNYEREHRYNLWFVVTADDRAGVEAVLAEIAGRTGLEPLDLPMLKDYFIDLGFRLQWP
jgi:DNA-binding Lrp family transcriptional regulator